MSQPFDNRDWDVRRIEELEAELDKALEERREWMQKTTEARQRIAALQREHEEMLLKHAKEQGVLLEALDKAYNEIERLRKQ